MNLEVIAPVIEQIVKDTLREKRYPFGTTVTGIGNKIASGTLVDSVQVVAAQEGQNQVLDINIAAYGNFVDLGRAPGRNRVPVEAIKIWMEEKGIGVRDVRGRYVQGHRKRAKSYKTGQEGIYPIAFAIQKNIQKFGIRPHGQPDMGFIAAALNNMENSTKLISLLEETTLNELLTIINTKFNTTE